MKRVLLAAIFSSLCFPAVAFAADEVGAAKSWTGRRADTIEKGRWEIGVFSPLKFAVTDSLELSTHPLAFLVVPNLSAKIAWNDDRPWRLATRHGLHYPTPLLKLLSREGSGGILPADTKVPNVFALTTEVIATTDWPLYRRWFTVRLGFTVAARLGGERLPPIELPVVFPRTAAYSSWGTGHAGLALEGQIRGPFYYLLDSAMFIIPGFEGAFAFEETAHLSWRPGDRFTMSVGGRIIYGGYPQGEQLHWGPTIDARIGF